MKLFRFAFTALLMVLLLLGCNDAQDITDELTAPNGPSLSSEQFSAEYSKEEAIEIFKSGDDEAIERVIKSKKSVIWDGKSKFENGVNYKIGPDQIEKARETSEGFRKANDIDRAWQRTGKLPYGEKIKTKSSSPGLAASGISPDAYTLCGQYIRVARAIVTVAPHVCMCHAWAYVRIGSKTDFGEDSGTGKFLYAAAMKTDYGGGQALAVAMGDACGRGDMDASGCY